MELNREQVIKALECCASNSLADCDCCPIDEQKKDNCECGRYVAIQALALIRELTEENEDKDETIAGLIGTIEVSYGFAIRNMQERLKQYIDVGHYRPPTEICFSELDVVNIIDQIAQDMMEENNG